MLIEEARRFIVERTAGFVAEVSSNLLEEAYSRYLNMLVKTPTERFRELVSRYPGVIHSLPIHEIASYLGISVVSCTASEGGECCRHLRRTLRRSAVLKMSIFKKTHRDALILML